MRIRSIKPEFYRSDDIDALDWHERLLFIALWSYVDDNGVGRDKVASIAADLFAGDLSVDPTETLRRVSLGLDALEKQGLITRYKVNDRSYLHIVAWEHHQLIKNPSKARFPLPTCDSSDSTERLRSVSGGVTEEAPTGTEEPRNRGAEEQGTPPTAAGAAVATRDDAQQLIGEWIEHCEERPPERVIGQVAKEAKAMLGEGISADRVRAGLADWHRKGLHPASLPSVVHEVTVRATGQSVSRRQAETNDMFDRAARRAIARDQQ